MTSLRKQQKVDLVDKLKEKVKRAKSLYWADYRGLSTTQITQLRDQIAQDNAELKVTKNTLLKRVLQETPNYELSTIDQILAGPTATLLTYEDEIAPLKALANFLKTAGIGKIKGGFLDHKFLSEEEAVKIALLPDRFTLRGQVVSSLSSPIYGLAATLQGNLQNLVFALDQLRSKKSPT